MKDRELIERLRAWMRGVMEVRQWSAEKWAKLAETSPTNITRILSEDDPPLPGARTLAKLANVAGSNPPITGLPTVRIPLTIPLIPLRDLTNAEGWSDLDMTKYERIPVDDSVPEHAIGLRVETDEMNAHGIMPGDILVIDQRALPLHGKIAVYQQDERVLCGLYAPPYLMPQSTNAKNIPLPLAELTYIGMAVRQIRKL